MGKVMYMRKGEIQTAPSTGILASELAVGSSVYLIDNGEMTEYIVVHQGRPDESNYGEDAIGTWIMRKDLPDITCSKTDAINLGTVYESRFDETTLGCIKESTLKYMYITTSSINGTPVASRGTCTQKIHSPGVVELDGESDVEVSTTNLQSVLSYFTGATNELRISHNIDGEADKYHTRDASTDNITLPQGGFTTTTKTHYVTASGSFGSSTTNMCVRPMMILDYNTKFNARTLLLKGV